MVSGFDLHDELEQGQAIDAERFERLAKEAFVAPSKMGARILGIQLRAPTRPLQPICVRCSSLAYSATKSTTTKSGDFMIATMNSDRRHTSFAGFRSIRWARSCDRRRPSEPRSETPTCLLYTSDAADDLLCVDLGG